MIKVVVKITTWLKRRRENCQVQLVAKCLETESLPQLLFL